MHVSIYKNRIKIEESERISYGSPILKHICTKRRSFCRIAGELKINRINSPCNDKKEAHKQYHVLNTQKSDVFQERL